jgi:hypothetical protein
MFGTAPFSLRTPVTKQVGERKGENPALVTSEATWGGRSKFMFVERSINIKSEFAVVTPLRLS